jgi:selenium metabolism protein YedF
MLDSGSGSFTVFVDNVTARDNVLRFSRTAGSRADATKAEGGYLVTIEPGEKAAAGPAVAEMPMCGPATGNRVIFIGSDQVGTGDAELGGTLMKMFLYTAAESEAPPAALIFMNSGVRLVTENDEAAAHVARLEEAGADVLVCGTCLDYYGLTDRLKAGHVSNMYDIQATMVGAGLLVSL